MPAVSSLGDLPEADHVDAGPSETAGQLGRGAANEPADAADDLWGLTRRQRVGGFGGGSA